MGTYLSWLPNHFDITLLAFKTSLLSDMTRCSRLSLHFLIQPRPGVSHFSKAEVLKAWPRASCDSLWSFYGVHDVKIIFIIRVITHTHAPKDTEGPRTPLRYPNPQMLIYLVKRKTVDKWSLTKFNWSRKKQFTNWVLRITANSESYLCTVGEILRIEKGK